MNYIKYAGHDISKLSNKIRRKMDAFSTKESFRLCCRFVYSKLDGRRDFPMSVLEIIVGAVVLLISVVLIIICMMQEQKPQNATAALTGASNDSFYDKNRGRTKEARLKKITFICSVVFFVLILFMDIVMPLLTK